MEVLIKGALIFLICLQILYLAYLIFGMKNRNMRLSGQTIRIGLFFFTLITIIGEVVMVITGYAISLIVSFVVAGLILFRFSISLRSALKNELAYEKELENQIAGKEGAEVASNSHRTTKDLLSVGTNFITEISEAVQDNKDLSDILNYFNTLIIEQLGADGGVILIADDFEDVLVVKSYVGVVPPPYKLPEECNLRFEQVQTNFRYAEFSLNNSIFGEVALSGIPQLIEDGTQDERIVNNGRESFLMPGSYLFIPLVSKNKVIGVITLARKAYTEQPFTERDIEIAQIFANYVSEALSLIYNLQDVQDLATKQNEMDIASKIQNTLLPKKLKDTADLELGIYFHQTKTVCSDYYDFIPLPEKRYLMILFDVTGKSMHSAMVMTMLRALCYLITGESRSTLALLHHLNRGITGKIAIDHYAAVGFLNYLQPEKAIEYASAGSQGLLLYSARLGKLSIVKQKTDPIGSDQNATYTVKKIEFEKNDIAILYTDGIIEALDMSGKQFGIEALSQTILKHKDKSAKEIAKKIEACITAFMGKSTARDDQTVVVIKAKR